jgi:hypothetical protein
MRGEGTRVGTPGVSRVHPPFRPCRWAHRCLGGGGGLPGKLVAGRSSYGRGSGDSSGALPAD